MNTAVIYYSDNSISDILKKICLQKLTEVIPGSISFWTFMQSPKAPRCMVNLYLKIACAVTMSNADYFYLAEHDVLYPEGYFVPVDDETDWDFQFTKGGYYLDETGYFKRPGRPLSSMLARREALISFCLIQLRTLLNGDKITWAEPQPDDWHIKTRTVPNPYIDIRHGANFTGARRGKVTLQSIPYWPPASELWAKLKEAK